MSYCTPATYLDMGRTMTDSNQERLVYGQISEDGKPGLDTDGIKCGFCSAQLFDVRQYSFEFVDRRIADFQFSRSISLVTNAH